MVNTQCLWDMAMMNSTTDSTNVLVANLKPIYFGHYMATLGKIVATAVTQPVTQVVKMTTC